MYSLCIFISSVLFSACASCATNWEWKLTFFLTVNIYEDTFVIDLMTMNDNWSNDRQIEWIRQITHLLSIFPNLPFSFITPYRLSMKKATLGTARTPKLSLCSCKIICRYCKKSLNLGIKSKITAVRRGLFSYVYGRTPAMIITLDINIFQRAMSYLRIGAQATKNIDEGVFWADLNFIDSFFDWLIIRL